MPIEASEAQALLEAAGFTANAEIVQALVQACEDRTAGRGRSKVDSSTEKVPQSNAKPKRSPEATTQVGAQPADRDVILRLNEVIDREVVSWKRPRF